MSESIMCSIRLGQILIFYSRKHSKPFVQSRLLPQPSLVSWVLVSVSRHSQCRRGVPIGVEPIGTARREEQTDQISGHVVSFDVSFRTANSGVFTSCSSLQNTNSRQWLHSSALFLLWASSFSPDLSGNDKTPTCLLNRHLHCLGQLCILNEDTY